MRLKIREIHGAYIGAHCEVVGPLGQRVFPPAEESRTMKTYVRKGKGPSTPTGPEILLGTNRDACAGFIAGYQFARVELAPPQD